MLGGTVRRTWLPVGLLMLLLTLGQAVVLALVFILYPLWRTRDQVRGVSGRAAYLLYFAALGLGFIFFEVTVIQKYSILLGGPVYSFAITLFSFLLDLTAVKRSTCCFSISGSIWNTSMGTCSAFS